MNPLVGVSPLFLGVSPPFLGVIPLAMMEKLIISGDNRVPTHPYPLLILSISKEKKKYVKLYGSDRESKTNEGANGHLSAEVISPRIPALSELVYPAQEASGPCGACIGGSAPSPPSTRPWLLHI